MRARLIKNVRNFSKFEDLFFGKEEDRLIYSERETFLQTITGLASSLEGKWRISSTSTLKEKVSQFTEENNAPPKKKKNKHNNESEKPPKKQPPLKLGKVTTPIGKSDLEISTK